MVLLQDPFFRLFCCSNWTGHLPQELLSHCGSARCARGDRWTKGHALSRVYQYSLKDQFKDTTEERRLNHLWQGIRANLKQEQEVATTPNAMLCVDCDTSSNGLHTLYTKLDDWTSSGIQQFDVQHYGVLCFSIF